MSSPSEPRTAKRAHGFTEFHANSFETEEGHRRVRVEKHTRMHKFQTGYERTGRERVVFSGKAGDAQMLHDVLGEVLNRDYREIGERHQITCPECGSESIEIHSLDRVSAGECIACFAVWQIGIHTDWEVVDDE